MVLQDHQWRSHETHEHDKLWKQTKVITLIIIKKHTAVLVCKQKSNNWKEFLALIRFQDRYKLYHTLDELRLLRSSNLTVLRHQMIWIKSSQNKTQYHRAIMGRKDVWRRESQELRARRSKDECQKVGLDWSRIDKSTQGRLWTVCGSVSFFM